MARGDPGCRFTGEFSVVEREIVCRVKEESDNGDSGGEVRLSYVTSVDSSSGKKDSAEIP
jgi:hypothetical protein